MVKCLICGVETRFNTYCPTHRQHEEICFRMYQAQQYGAPYYQPAPHWPSQPAPHWPSQPAPHWPSQGPTWQERLEQRLDRMSENLTRQAREVKDALRALIATAAKRRHVHWPMPTNPALFRRSCCVTRPAKKSKSDNGDSR